MGPADLVSGWLVESLASWGGCGGGDTAGLAGPPGATPRAEEADTALGTSAEPALGRPAFITVRGWVDTEWTFLGTAF